MKLYELLSSVEVFSYEMPSDLEITGITSDSRQVNPGNLFVCIRGMHEDGHMYMHDALRAGACAVMTEMGCTCVPEGVPHITVPSTRSALAKLYHAWYGRPGDSLRLIAVTGTNGKTSVSFMLRAIWEASMEPCGLIGTVHCCSCGRLLDSRPQNALANMTTPDPEELYRLLAEMKADGAKTVILEATSHALALGKLDALHFDVAIFTNLTPEHLDFHGTMERYFEAKAKLFDMCDLAILNRDDPWSELLAKRIRCDVRFCSILSDRIDYAAQDVENVGIEGVSYCLQGENVRMRMHCPIPGTFSVMNSLQAAVTALERDKTPACIQDAIGALNGVQGRMERVRLPLEAEFSVFIDYAHTPDALENLLRTARGFCGERNRLVVLFGCGGDRDKGKRPMMGRLAATLADFAIVTSDNSRTEDPLEIVDDILAGMREIGARNYRAIIDRREAICYALTHARAGDVILLAGKGHETYEINQTGRHPFDERVIVTQILDEYFSRDRGEQEND